MKYTNKALLSLLILTLTLSALSVNAMDKNGDKSSNLDAAVNILSNTESKSSKTEKVSNSGVTSSIDEEKNTFSSNITNAIDSTWIWISSNPKKVLGAGVASLAAVYGIKKLNDSANQKRGLAALQEYLEKEETENNKEN